MGQLLANTGILGMAIEWCSRVMASCLENKSSKIFSVPAKEAI